MRGPATDLKAMEAEVRAIHKDGLLWGAGAACSASYHDGSDFSFSAAGALWVWKISCSDECLSDSVWDSPSQTAALVLLELV